MPPQHQNLDPQIWQQLTLSQQLANVGSEVIRSLNWQKKDNHNYSQLAFYPSLELLSLSINDPKNLTSLKELTRTYEILVDYFTNQNSYQTQAQDLEKYFLAFNYSARKNT